MKCCKPSQAYWGADCWDIAKTNKTNLKLLKMKPGYLLIAFLLLAGNVLAQDAAGKQTEMQSYILRGKVTDMHTNQEIPNVLVLVWQNFEPTGTKGGKMLGKALTDSSGFYRIEVLAPRDQSGFGALHFDCQDEAGKMHYTITNSQMGLRLIPDLETKLQVEVFESSGCRIITTVSKEDNSYRKVISRDINGIGQLAPGVFGRY